MAKTISWGNQKGGVTKTTSCAATSYILSKKGYHVLCVDFDAQGNLVQVLTGRSTEDFSDYNILVAIEDNEPFEHIYEISDTLHIIPSDRYLANFVDFAKEKYPDDDFQQSQILKEFLKPLQDQYDFIMIDLPPALDLLTINGLAASDYTVGLLQPVPLAWDSLNKYIDTVESLKENGVNEKLDVIGVLLTLVDRGQTVDNQFVDLAEEVYGDLLFKAKVYRRTRLKQYPAIGIQEDSYLDKSALKPYYNLVGELFERVKQT